MNTWTHKHHHHNNDKPARTEAEWFLPQTPSSHMNTWSHELQHHNNDKPVRTEAEWQCGHESQPSPNQPAIPRNTHSMVNINSIMQFQEIPVNIVIVFGYWEQRQECDDEDVKIPGICWWHQWGSSGLKGPPSSLSNCGQQWCWYN